MFPFNLVIYHPRIVTIFQSTLLVYIVPLSERYLTLSGNLVNKEELYADMLMEGIRGGFEGSIGLISDSWFQQCFA